MKNFKRIMQDIVELETLIPISGDDTDWEILDRDRRWSDPIDSSLFHEHFLAIPGYGDVTLHVEQVCSTLNSCKNFR